MNAVGQAVESIKEQIKDQISGMDPDVAVLVYAEVETFCWLRVEEYKAQRPWLRSRPDRP